MYEALPAGEPFRSQCQRPREKRQVLRKLKEEETLPDVIGCLDHIENYSGKYSEIEYYHLAHESIDVCTHQLFRYSALLCLLHRYNKHMVFCEERYLYFCLCVVFGLQSIYVKLFWQL